MVACSPPNTGVVSGLGCCVRYVWIMSGSMVLSQLGSVLISMTHVVTKAIGMPGVWADTCGHFGV